MQLTEDAPRRIQDPLTCLSQHHLPSDSVEQRRAEALFDVEKLMTQRRLCQMEPLSGTSQIAFGSHRENQPKVTYFDIQGMHECIRVAHRFLQNNCSPS